MRDTTAIVKNISNLQEAFDAAMYRDSAVEGMVVVHGKTGAGKTTAITWLTTQLMNNDIHPIWVEASPSWSLKSMLADICRACAVEPKGSSADLAAIVKEQMQMGKPLFIDEVDHLFLPGQETTLRMIEQIRSLYDFSKTPVVLIGMDKLERKLKTREQLYRRVFQWVEFKDLDRADIRILADALLDVPVADDFLGLLIEKTGGRVGRIVLGLAQAERRAKGNKWPEINLDRWGDKPLNLGR
jgi:DNA transposition AAA+ family ATPase